MARDAEKTKTRRSSRSRTERSSRRSRRDRSDSQPVRTPKELLDKKGVFRVDVFNDGTELRGKIAKDEGGITYVMYKEPAQKRIMVRGVLSENVVAVAGSSVHIKGRVRVGTYWATKIIRKGDSIGLITLEGEKVVLRTLDVDITRVIKDAEKPKEDEEEDEDEKPKKKKKVEDEDDEDEDEKPKKKKKKVEDDDNEDEEDEDDEKPKKKKQTEDEDEDDDDAAGDDFWNTDKFDE